jgi:hypothetical protein
VDVEGMGTRILWLAQQLGEAKTEIKLLKERLGDG